MDSNRIDGTGSLAFKPGYVGRPDDKLFRQAVNETRSSTAAPVSTNAPIWSSSAPYGDFSHGGYSWNNDIYGGKAAGPQTISVHADNQWSVWSNQPNTDGIKSYPHQAFNVGKPLSSINTLTSSFNQDVPVGGAWNTAYDIWDGSQQNEIMLWTNYTGNPDGSGNVKPISYHYDASGASIPIYRNVNVGGATWNVFEGYNGHKVISLLCTSKTNNGTVDIKSILDWLKSKGHFGDINVGSVQYGAEITASPGGKNFNFKNCSVSSTPIDAVDSNPNVSSHVVDRGAAVSGAADRGATPPRKVDPNSDEQLLSAAIDAFLPSMVSNTLMLNNSLFNFAKEAIDEGDEG